MTKRILVQRQVFISDIMCHSGCGSSLNYALNNLFEEFKDKKYFPQDAQLSIYPQPEKLGVHSLEIKIKTEEATFTPPENLCDSFFDELNNRLVEMKGPQITDDPRKAQTETSGKINWINILINLLAMGVITLLWFFFPPSIPLTIVLTTISFLTTGFTAREYLINFFRNLRSKNLANMTTTISFGWFLSLAHTLYHSIMMPMASSFSMAFMSFVMPVMLITLVNGMDEIKRIILNKSKKMRLQGMDTLFPEMKKEYPCYQLSSTDQVKLSELIAAFNKENSHELREAIQDLFTEEGFVKESTDELREGMYIEVDREDCFPVDCILIQGNTTVDPSILSGEHKGNKKFLDLIPAGAVNLGNKVTVYAKANAYDSTINKILFRANRARENRALEPSSKFTYLYTGLIIAGIIASIAAPLAFGVFTIPLLLQNIMGILFAVCPCTIAIGHQLPTLLSIFHRSNKGIILRDDELSGRSHKIHTVVFDKTGTLTTGKSRVTHCSDTISEALWERIYLLEKEQGGEHPIAKALVNFRAGKPQPIINNVSDVVHDFKNRGLSAKVQGVEICLGNAAYFEDARIKIPSITTPPGVTSVYVAENNSYKGVIFIQHEPRPGIQKTLERLKEKGVNLIMLTGDNPSSAMGFNQQLGGVFADENIRAEKTPEKKEKFLVKLIKKTKKRGESCEGIWFIGDGINDAPCARIVSEEGGTSCAMNSGDKAAFFTDISLNGSLKYLFKHRKLNLFLEKNILQNQWLIAQSSAIFLAFIISFSIVGIAVSPLIPLAIMLSTTFLVLFNSYRTQLSIDNALDKTSSLTKELLASDLSIGLLVGASTLFICAVLVATLATGGLAFPAIVFTAGAALAASSACLITAGLMFGIFSLIATSYLFMNNCSCESVETGEDFSVHSLVEPSSLSVQEREPSVLSDFGITRYAQRKTDSSCNEDSIVADTRRPSYESCP
ncbi:HAD-IC family P-type ATPase [Legionella sp.]|uniref:HAD-IC family P-type ATPase n=1 Tax=Legionella sp. TaxID=459 RepID=UPI000CAC0917|nr:HAD-IC family P-type ATPase [Legionella sp.]PJE10580.1 MAG: hypothetical protein CK430_10025 [Legionella sp.]